MTHPPEFSRPLSPSFPLSIGSYCLRREIGRGFSSLVYEAHDPIRERVIALKVLTLGQTLSEERRQDMAARFQREARAISALAHPGIVEISDFGQAEDGRHFIAMERLEGETLRALLDRRGTLPPEEAVALVRQVAEALQYAHGEGIVHRDVKPDNIFVLPSGHAKLMDFGVAHIISEAALTQTGTVVGSPAYMSPEQIGGQRLDGSSDVFSLGVTLAEMLTGEKPFDAPTIPAVMQRILHRPPQIARVQPRALRKVLEKALAKNPFLRYPTAAAFAAALRHPALPLPGSTATRIMSSVASSGHPSGGTDHLRDSVALFPHAPSRTALWTALLVCLAVVVTLPLRHFPTMLFASQGQGSTHQARLPGIAGPATRFLPVSQISAVWRRMAPRQEGTPLVGTIPAKRIHSASAFPAARIVPIVQILAPVSPRVVHPLMAVTLTASPAALPDSPAVTRIAGTRQELPGPVSGEMPAETAPMPFLPTGGADDPAILPHLLHSVPAIYPVELQEAGVTGDVMLRLSISTEGEVTEATVTHSSGVDDLDAAALDAVGHWKYAPAMQDGQAIPAAATARIHFR